MTITAAARADDGEARRHYERAVKAYNLQEFRTALDEFKAAYTERSDAVFLFNIAQTYRQLGQYEAAAKSYRAFLHQAPNALNRAEVERLIEQMDQAARDRRASEPPTGPTPPPTSNTEAPSKVTPPVEPPARETAPNGATAARSATTTAAVPADAVVATRPAPPPSRAGRGKQIGGLVVGVVGVGALAAGIAFGVLAQQVSDELTRLGQDKGTFDYAKQQDGKRNQIIEGVGIGVGTAALVTGTVLYVLGRRDARRAERRPLTLLPTLAPGNAGLALVGRF